MAFEIVQAEIGELLSQMQDGPEDKHELLLQLHQKIQELKAFGLPVPEDLLELEREIGAELESEAIAIPSDPAD